MKVIGITGGVGSGKSALLNAISKEYNCKILLADDIANLLKEPGQCCYVPLIKLLGEQVLDEAGFLDKKKMSDAIFQNQELLTKVNEIVHPAVKEYIRTCIGEEREKKQVDFVFVEAALFIEAGYRDMVDSLWYIYADRLVRIQRLVKGRGYTDSKIHDIMNKQLQEEEFRANCDVVIDNSGTLDEAMEQVKRNLQTNEIM